MTVQSSPNSILCPRSVRQGKTAPITLEYHPQMFSIYKTSTIALVAIVATSMALSLSSVTSAQSHQFVPTAEAATTGAVEVSRSDARSIVNEYLRDNGKRNLRAGRTHADGDYWVVKISTPMGVDAGALKVHRVSGELSKV